MNLLRADPESVLAGLPFEPDPVPGVAGGYVADAAHRAALVEGDAVRDGKVWIQNPSSMLPPVVLAPRAGDSVLDLAAAPGSTVLSVVVSIALAVTDSTFSDEPHY